MQKQGRAIVGCADRDDSMVDELLQLKRAADSLLLLFASNDSLARAVSVCIRKHSMSFVNIPRHSRTFTCLMAG